MIDHEHGAFDLETFADLACCAGGEISADAPWANANIIVCVSIESLEGLENVEAMAAVEGIDMIVYGHSDLSARLGCKVLNLPGTDVSTYLDGLRARAGRANAWLKAIGVPIP